MSYLFCFFHLNLNDVSSNFPFFLNLFLDISFTLFSIFPLYVFRVFLSFDTIRFIFIYLLFILSLCILLYIIISNLQRSAQKKTEKEAIASFLLPVHSKAAYLLKILKEAVSPSYRSTNRNYFNTITFILFFCMSSKIIFCFILFYFIQLHDDFFFLFHLSSYFFSLSTSCILINFQFNIYFYSFDNVYLTN